MHFRFALRALKIAWAASLLLPSWLLATDLADPAMTDQPGPQRLQIDPAGTRVAFDIAALWILKRRGEFGDIEGALTIAADSRTAVIEVRIGVASVEMPNPDHTRLLLSPQFFDAEAYPWIEFRSDSFALDAGGRLQLPGTLQVRGISQRVQFAADAGRCAPKHSSPCEVEVSGTLQRSRFGMTEYRRTLADDVHLRIFATMFAADSAEAEPALPEPVVPAGDR